MVVDSLKKLGTKKDARTVRARVTARDQLNVSLAVAAQKKGAGGAFSRC